MLFPRQPELKHPLDVDLTTLKPKCGDENLIRARIIIGSVFSPIGRPGVETCYSFYMRENVLKSLLLLNPPPSLPPSQNNSH